MSANASQAPQRPCVGPRAALALSCAVVLLGSLGLFVWGLGAARDVYFDETWYVPTARGLIKSGAMMHQEHPPLGKLMIASGMRVFGDNPFGWRATSALFGSLTLVGVLIWSYALLRDLGQALWASAITLFDSIVYVQARIAMLDIFLMAFCAFALAFFTLSLKERKSPAKSLVYAMLMGVCLGLASACKLSGLFLLGGILAVRLLIGLLKLWRTRFEGVEETDFFAPDAWAALTPANTFLALVAAPLLVYFAAYLPQLVHEGSILEFFAAQRRMIAIMTGSSVTHPYSSLWLQWPTMTRPVWYLFHVASPHASAWSAQAPAQAIVALVNPLVFYSGEAAILVAAWCWIVRREVDAMIVTVGFFAQYLPWAINPKGLEFFYYYFPSLLCLGPALALLFFRGGSRLGSWLALGFLALAGLTFVFYLPVLSAQFPVGPSGFSERIWFDSWR
jgi:dolichyl-phosphate-mannose--protein O-mannosyl transferase